VSQRIRMPYIPHGDLEFFNEKAPFRKSKGFYSALKACVVIPYPHIESNELDSFPGTESYPFLDSATNASIS